MRTFQTLGFAGGAAAHDVDTALGPWYWYQHPELFTSKNIMLDWLDIVTYHTQNRGLDLLPELEKALLRLQQQVNKHLKNTSPLLLLGGDHTMAMGTWPTIAKHYPHMGLLWVDAHFDAHTPNDSVSKNIHGMPLARLLGIWGGEAIFQASQICVIGVRSYEDIEYQHLRKSGVKIIMMDEIYRDGITQKLQEALSYLKENHTHLAMSIDLDAFDPHDCPGVGYREPRGIRSQEFFEFFKKFAYHDWVAIEVAEFNPMRDTQQKTAQWLPDFLDYLYG